MIRFFHYTLKTEQRGDREEIKGAFGRSSPRTISTAKLNVLPRLHMQPINLVVFKGPYQLMLWDILS